MSAAPPLRAPRIGRPDVRAGLNDDETSKARRAEMRQAEAEAKREVSADSAQTDKGGRPPKGDVSRRAIAERTGIPRTTQRDTERHVALAEQYPFMPREELPRGTGPRTALVVDMPDAMTEAAAP